MRLSWRWLARHVDLSGLTPQGVAGDLTLSVAEVEGLEPFAPVLADVAVGHVLARERHPDADKLSVCRVDVGDGTPLQIVCGAANVAAGQKVAVAVAGTTLPGDLKIKRSKIRGVESQGMICSQRELGLGEDAQGIWVLPAEAVVGRKVGPALELSDWVIEIDNKSITHRPDLWGHRGFAAEIGAIHRRTLAALELSLPPAGKGAAFPVRIDSPACRRYVALPIDGAHAERSPDWLRLLLLAVGQRPIDELVDLCNFVALERGQPSHLFDRQRLSPEGIVVRPARAGERLTTLDGTERVLAPADLLICSGPEPVALAGVMGGVGSKVEAGTRQLLLEAAAFDPVGVRRTSARLGLRTDASTRFEKSLDPHLPLEAAAHFVRLLKEIQPEVVLPARATDVGGWKDPSRVIRLRPARVRKLLGVEVADEKVADILVRLGFGVERSGAAWSVRVPAPRATKDIQIEQDLVEEVGRILRYGSIPEAALTGRLEPPARDEAWNRRMLVHRIEERLAGDARFHQTLSYSFVSERLLAALGMAELPHVEVVNPVAEGLGRVRRSVVPSLLGLLEENRRQRDDVRLFEIGKGYLPETPNQRGEPREVHEAALVWAGIPAPAARFDATRAARMQAVIEDLLDWLERPRPQWRALEGDQRPLWAHPARALGAWLGEAKQPAVTLAPLDPLLARDLGLAGELASEVAVACVSLEALLAAPQTSRAYKALPAHPGAKLDVALVAPEKVLAADLLAAIERAGKGLVASAELFDLFVGESLGPGRKSLAWHVVLQAGERTLSDQDAQKFLSRLEREAAELGGALRRA